MIKKINIVYFFILLVLIGCTSQHDKKHDLSKSPKNIYFTQQAELLFGSILLNKMSFSSYSSDKVSYIIYSNNFKIENFNKDKNQLLKNNSWEFYKKINSSYIYCNGVDELEIITPMSIYGNEKLHTGSTGMQLEDGWNILFSHPKNSTTYECNRR